MVLLLDFLGLIKIHLLCLNRNKWQNLLRTVFVYYSSNNIRRATNRCYYWWNCCCYRRYSDSSCCCFPIQKVPEREKYKSKSNIYKNKFYLFSIPYIYYYIDYYFVFRLNLRISRQQAAGNKRTDSSNSKQSFYSQSFCFLLF